jgi:hypothetical protein
MKFPVWRVNSFRPDAQVRADIGSDQKRHRPITASDGLDGASQLPGNDTGFLNWQRQQVNQVQLGST